MRGEGKGERVAEGGVGVVVWGEEKGEIGGVIVIEGGGGEGEGEGEVLWRRKRGILGVVGTKGGGEGRKGVVGREEGREEGREGGREARRGGGVESGS